MIDPGIYFFHTTTVILALPIVTVIVSAVLMATIKVHKHTNLSRIKLVLYNSIGYSLACSEKLFTIAVTMTYLRCFVCGAGRKNIAGEDVVSGFETCWSPGHIFFSMYAIISMVCFYGAFLVFTFAFSMNYFKSPLPWADESAWCRLLVAAQKVTMSAFLIFDPEVILADL